MGDNVNMDMKVRMRKCMTVCKHVSECMNAHVSVCYE